MIVALLLHVPQLIGLLTWPLIIFCGGYSVIATLMLLLYLSAPSHTADAQVMLVANLPAYWITTGIVNLTRGSFQREYGRWLELMILSHPLEKIERVLSDLQEVIALDDLSKYKLTHTIDRRDVWEIAPRDDSAE